MTDKSATLDPIDSGASHADPQTSAVLNPRPVPATIEPHESVPRGNARMSLLRTSMPGMVTTYRFECPYCGSVTSIEPQYAGLTGPCYSCGKMVTVPTVEELESLQRRRAAAPQGNSRLNVFLTIGLLASTLVGGICAVAALFFFFLPGLVRTSSIADASTKLEQVRLALELYHDRWGSYPPAYIADDKGRPMHSWRVLILDELGYSNLKQRYDFSKPWDSIENQALLTEIPGPYAIDVDTSAYANMETSVVAIVGDGTLFPGKSTARRSDIKDDFATTLMAVERHESGIGWMEPRDLVRSRMSNVINGSGANDIHVLRPEGAVAVMADGSTRTLSPRFSPAALSAITTIAGGETVPLSEFDAK
ncbi:MAG TPA: DUF1559 domain-containing protein [Pirellulaceae bacterium]|jgi:hypothetical protein|nr:DUF1559 domain-containing protein [Pirellulaceae bacterium]